MEGAPVAKSITGSEMNYAWQSPLAALGLEATASIEQSGDAGVWICERPRQRQWALRGDGADKAFVVACRDGLGFDLPLSPNTVNRKDRRAALWLGPEEWLLVAASDDTDLEGDLRKLLGNSHYAITEVSESRAVFGLSVNRARDLLAKGCAIDLHEKVFAVDACASTILAHCHVTVHRQPDDDRSQAVFDLYFHRSFAEYAWRWMLDAGLEFAIVVTRP